MKKILIAIFVTIIMVSSFSLKVKAIGASYCCEGLDITFDDSNHQPAGAYNYPFITEYTGANDVSYNCHFYTFFATVTPRFNNINNPGYYWLEDDVMQFFDNDIYIETDRYHAEIIAYYDANDEIKHTGRVFEAMDGVPCGWCGDANLVKVRSKMGAGYVYDHFGNFCEYAGYPNGNGSYVKYYEYNHALVSTTHNIFYAYENNQHSKVCFTSYCRLNLIIPHNIVAAPNNYTNTGHSLICSLGSCGYVDSEEHSFLYSIYDSEQHRKHCSACNYYLYEYHSWQQISDLMFKCTLCNQRAAFIPIIHDGFSQFGLMMDDNVILYNGTYYRIILIYER